MNTDLVRINTPWEQHEDVWVKREDLSSPFGPRFSKIRGVYECLIKLPKHTTVGVLDTVHSKGGWGVAYICAALNLQCVVFYPGDTPRIGQIKAKEHGADLVSLKPGRSAILWYRSRKILQETYEASFMMPNGLQLEESIESTRLEVLRTDKNLLRGTWVVSASTGTIAAGVYKGLEGRADLIVHLGFSRSHAQMFKRVGPDITIVDEGYSYADSVNYPCPFPCNPYYDLKAWKWLMEHKHELVKPIIFWNIGD